MATKQSTLPAIAPQVYEHEQFGSIRIIGDTDNPRFCLADACKMLGIGNPSDVKKRLDDGVVSIEGITDSMGRIQNVTFINEDGLYDLILDSRKPEARKIRKWLTSEVMPSLRKNGVYIDPTAPINPAFLRRMADEIEQRDKQIAALTEENAQLKPKADYTEAVLISDEHLTSELIAKEYGQGGQWLNETLCKLGKIYRRGRHYFMKAPYAKDGYRTSETVTLERGKTVTNHYWTQRGRWFIYATLKGQGILPLTEQASLMATLL